MKKMQFLGAIALSAVFIAPAFASNKHLKSLKIQSVFLYSKMLSNNDPVEQRQEAWIRQAIVNVMNWSLVSKRDQAQATIILLPHAPLAGESSEYRSRCVSTDGELTCGSNQGGWLDIQCLAGNCASASGSNYLSVLVAVPVGSHGSKKVKLVWRKDTAPHVTSLDMASQNPLGIHVGPQIGDQDQATMNDIYSMCYAFGRGSRRKCHSLAWKSWKSFNKDMRRHGTVVRLP